MKHHILFVYACVSFFTYNSAMDKKIEPPKLDYQDDELYLYFIAPNRTYPDTSFSLFVKEPEAFLNEPKKPISPVKIRILSFPPYKKERK